MSLLKGLEIVRKRRASAAGSLMTEGIQISAVGVVHTIASVIQNKDAIKSGRVLKEAINKLERSVMRTARDPKKAKGGDEESQLMKVITTMAKTAAKEVLTLGVKWLFRAMTQAVRLVIVPVFRIFAAAVATTLRIILSNPYTLAATSVIVAGFTARKMYLDYQKEKRTGEILPDLKPTSSRKVGAQPSYQPSASDIPTYQSLSTRSGQGGAPTLPSGERDMKMRDIIADAARRNNVPVELALRVANIESSLNPNAGSSTSSAKGLFGMTKGTWKSLGGVPGMENDPVANADLGTKYLRSNYLSIKKSLGREAYLYEVYAAHHFGPGVAAMLKVQDQIAHRPIEYGLALFNSEGMVKKIMEQNPHLRGKTVGQVLDSLKDKAGTRSMADNIPEQVTTKQGGPVSAVVPASGSFAIPTTGTFTSPFGPRTFMGPKGMVTSGNHGGIDIANSVGTPIYAADAGRVTVSSLFSSGYGTRIDIDHGNGFMTRYGHSSKLFVKEGDSVRKGQHIAAMGNAGFSSGPHLHFEVRKVTAQGDPSSVLDPALYLQGFPTTKNAKVEAGGGGYSQPTAVASNTQKQYIRRDEKVVALRG